MNCSIFRNKVEIWYPKSSLFIFCSAHQSNTKHKANFRYKKIHIVTKPLEYVIPLTTIQDNKQYSISSIRLDESFEVFVWRIKMNQNALTSWLHHQRTIAVSQFRAWSNCSEIVTNVQVQANLQTVTHFSSGNMSPGPHIPSPQLPPPPGNNHQSIKYQHQQ